MASTLLLLQSALLILTALVYAYVGRRILARPIEGDGRLAARLFGVWWFTLAGIQVLNATRTVLGAFDVRDLAVHVTLMHAMLALLCIALASLLYYLIYLLTGSKGSLWAIMAGYVAYYLFIEWIVAAGAPSAVEISARGAEIVYARELPQPWTDIAAALLLGPPLVASIGYFSLFFRVPGRLQRYRIGLVSLTIFGWFMTSVAATSTGLSRVGWWPVAGAFIGLAAAGAIFAAYHPPRWIEARVTERVS